MEDIRKRDAENLKREKEWKEEMTRRVPTRISAKATRIIWLSRRLMPI